MEPNRSDTPEFRAEAVKWVLEPGLSLAEAAERLLIPKGTLTPWVGKAKGGKAPAAPGARSVAEWETEVRQRRKELAEARREGGDITTCRGYALGERMT